MAVPPIDLVKQYEPLADEIRAVFDRILTTGRFVLGADVEQFEDNLAAYCEAKYAVGVSSGTDALIIALMAADVGPGDEVITTAFTFFATAGSIARVGARPVFVDIDPVTFNIDPAKIEGAITSKTKAIMPVHLYGQASEMGLIVDIADKHKLVVIEDAAQAIGAKSLEGKVGSIGHITCFSFYPTKNLSAMGDAGGCTTNDPALYEKLKVLRQHGETSRYHHKLVGGNFRIDALQAAVLNVKLPYLDQYNSRRRQLAGQYAQLFDGLPIRVPVEAEGISHVYHQYTIRVLDGKRDRLTEHLRDNSIGHGVFYPVPLHLQECFADLGGKVGDLPEVEQATEQVLSLPICAELTDEQQQEVATVIKTFFD